MKTLITQWGRDPIWTSSGINTLAPSRSAFPLAKYSGPIGFDASGAAVAPPAMVQTFRDEHAGLPSGNYKVAALRAPSTPSDKTLEVAPHAVGYDTDRQLWYCDIVIRPPSQSYYPFVRLALARYQPVSAEDCYLSAVVTTEFHQLSPDRAAIVNQTGNGAKASIAVYGFAPADIVPGAAGAAIFRAKTQVLKSGGDADLDWTDATGTSVAATPTAGIGNTALVAGATSSTRLGAQFQLSNATQQAFTTNNISSLPGLGLGDLLAPALLWTWEGNLPPIPAGGKRRVLITESESYVNSDLHTATNNNLTSRGERIVYAEAVEI